MAKLVQRRRGTTVEHDTFTGAEGEITQDTDKETIVVHDGTTVGGFPLAREDLDNVNLANKIGITELNVSSNVANGQILTTDSSGNLSFSSIDLAGAAVGGDLTGTISNAQIGVDTVGISELNVTDGIAGQLLSTNGSGVLSFESPSSITLGGDLSGTTSNAQILAGAVGTSELSTNAVTTIKITDANVTSQKIATDAITTSKILDANVTSSKIADANITVSKMAAGSVRSLNIINNNILTQHIADSQVTKLKIADSSVDVAKLDVTDGNSGELLSTNGSGVLSFIPQLVSLAVGGNLTGTTANAVIADGSVINAMLATGIDSSKLTGALPALDGSALTGSGLQVFGTSNTIPQFSSNGTTFSVTGVPFAPKALLMTALPTQNNLGDDNSIGFAINNNGSSIVQYSGRRTSTSNGGYNFSNACCSVTQTLNGNSVDFVDITITAFDNAGGSFSVAAPTNHAQTPYQVGIMWLG
jgi:hypothetical protein